MTNLATTGDKLSLSTSLVKRYEKEYFLHKRKNLDWNTKLAQNWFNIFPRNNSWIQRIYSCNIPITHRATKASGLSKKGYLKSFWICFWIASLPKSKFQVLVPKYVYYASRPETMGQGLTLSTVNCFFFILDLTGTLNDLTIQRLVDVSIDWKKSHFGVVVASSQSPKTMQCLLGFTQKQSDFLESFYGTTIWPLTNLWKWNQNNLFVTDKSSD